MEIRNGYIMDPVSRTEGFADLLIRDGRIARVIKKNGGFVMNSGNTDHGSTEVVDASGCVIAPGLVDVHVHFRDPGFVWKEDLQSGSAAAAKGGVTSVVCMANTNPVVDEPEVLQDILERAEDLPVRLYQASAVTRGLKGKQLVAMEDMAAAGAVCFTDDGMPLIDEHLLLEAMERAAKLHLPVSLHEEHPMFVKEAGVHAGEAAAILGYGGAFAEAEDILVARDIVLALKSGARVCIQHISSARSVELVRLAKKWGADVHAEATPHHFTLTQDAVIKYGTNARMNPPLRTEQDREAIIEGLKDGTIDLIATDHAPHSAEEKEKALPEAPSGIIGLETSLALGIKSLVLPGHLSLMQLLSKMSEMPARIYGLEPGQICEGSEADLVIFSETETWKADRFVSRASNSPFLGWTLPGKIHAVICRGKIVYR